MDGRDFQRWASVAAGALLAAAGLKKGGRSGVLMSLAGGAISAGAYLKLGKRGSAFAAGAGSDWEVPQDRLAEDAKAFSRSRHDAAAGSAGDRVVEASDDSFPASDAPAFTPTTSLGKHEHH